MRKIQKGFLLGGVLLLIAAILVGALLLHMGQERFLKESYPLKYEELVEKYAKEFELSPALVYAVIRCESSFRPDAVSYANAKGLMQLTDASFEWALFRLGETEGDVFDPETNIRCGTRLLRYLMDKFENEQTALAAYNAGAGTVSEWLKNTAYSDDGKTLHTIPYAETTTYVKRVADAKKQYQTLYGIA